MSDLKCECGESIFFRNVLETKEPGTIQAVIYIIKCPKCGEEFMTKPRGLSGDKRKVNPALKRMQKDLLGDKNRKKNKH